jgi:hypothetical protein
MIDDIATAFLKALAPFVEMLANGGFRRQSAEPLMQKLYCGNYSPPFWEIQLDTVTAESPTGEG